MNDVTRHLLDEALKLPLAEREELLARLQASVDVDEGMEVDPGWLAELDRRAAEDPARDRPWDEVLARLNAKHGYK